MPNILCDLQMKYINDINLYTNYILSIAKQKEYHTQNNTLCKFDLFWRFYSAEIIDHLTFDKNTRFQIIYVPNIVRHLTK